MEGLTMNKILDEFYIRKSSSEYIKKAMVDLDNNYITKSKDEITSSLRSILIDYHMSSPSNKFDDTIDILSYIEKYSNYFTPNNILQIYFYIPQYELLEKFIQNHYGILKEAFKTHYIAFDHLDNIGEIDTDIFEYQLLGEATYNRAIDYDEIIIVPKIYNHREFNYLLYKYFFDDLQFIFYDNHHQNNRYYGICTQLSWTYLQEIIIDLLNKNDYKTIDTLIEKYISVFDGENDNLEYPFNTCWFLKKIFNLRIKNKPRDYNDLYCRSIKWENKMRSRLEPSISTSSSVFSEEFFANLNYLRQIPRIKWKEIPLYERNFQMFNNYLSEIFSYDISECASIIRALYHRLIMGESLIKILKLESRTSLHHFYKTNEVLDFDSNEDWLTYVKNYTTKQYYDIKKIFSVDKSEYISFFYTFSSDRMNRDVIKFLYYLPYDLLKRLILNKVETSTLLKICSHSFASSEAKDLFIKLINDRMDEFTNNIHNLDAIFKMFDYLYSQGFKHITLPQIIKRIYSIDNLLMPNCYNIAPSLNLLDNVNKGNPTMEKINGILLYDTYRSREYSSIPDIKGTYGSLEYETVDMHSPEIISNGIGRYLHSNTSVTASSCLTPNGKASSCLFHGATNVHGRFFKITYQGMIVAYSWLWRAGDIMCFDNIEVTSEALRFRGYAKIIIDIYKKASEEFLSISSNSEERPIKAITIGRNDLDVIKEPLIELPEIPECSSLKPNSKENLYMPDSSKHQYLLNGSLSNNIITEDVKPIYKYKHPEALMADSNDPDIIKQLNSIYFDYCILTNKKYNPLKPNYTKCYISDNWFIGFYENETYDFYYRFIDDDVINSVSPYIKRPQIIVYKPVIKGDYPDFRRYLDEQNYVYNKDEVLEYLKNIKTKISIGENDFFHTPSTLANLGEILYDRAITSSFYGHHDGGLGANGNHFICVARINSHLFHSLKSHGGFIIDKDICAFETQKALCIKEAPKEEFFKNSRYPIREMGELEELQVLDYISLDSVKALLASSNIVDLGIITYLQELTDNDLPLITPELYSIDPKEIKRLIKLK